MSNFEKSYKNNLMKQINNLVPYDEAEMHAKNEILKYLKENDNYLGEDDTIGHITASAWIVNNNKDKVILTFHKKLEMWIQLGGHTEKNETVIDAALREAYEESGLEEIRVLDENIFDVDVHEFPEKDNNKSHYHYDIRYLLEADEDKIIKISNESKDVKWVKFDELDTLIEEKALKRMMEKVLIMRS